MENITIEAPVSSRALPNAPACDFVDEQWAPAYGFAGLYEVSTYGRVRSLSRTVPSRGGFRLSPGKILSSGKTNQGYVLASFSRDGKPHYRLVHRLVLESFVGPQPDGCVCCHANGDNGDNRLSNLRWDTQKANMLDARNHGTITQGTKNGNARLTESLVIEIRNSSESNSQIAARLGVKSQTVWRVRKGLSWTHVRAA